MRQRAAELAAQAQQVQIQDLLAAARKNMATGALWQPAGACAADRYRAVLKLEPSQPEALAGAHRLAGILAEEARRTEAAGDIYNSILLIGQIRSLQPDNPKLHDLQARLQQIEANPFELAGRERNRLQRAAAYIAQADRRLGHTPLDGGAVDDATDAYDRAVGEEPNAPGLPSLKVRLISAYAAAAQTELSQHDTQRALQLINEAHRRHWSSAELDRIQASILLPAASASAHRSNTR